MCFVQHELHKEMLTHFQVSRLILAALIICLQSHLKLTIYYDVSC